MRSAPRGRERPAGRRGRALVDEQPVGREQPRQMGRDPVEGRRVVGRIAEDQVVRAALLRERARRVLAEHGAACRRSFSRFALIVRHASRSSSTNDAVAAPRESASSPSAPEPAKRSSTAASSTGPIRLKAFSRTRSEVGRVSRPFGAAIRCPRWVPAMILTGGQASDRPRPGVRHRARRRGLPRPARGRPRRELPRELACLLDQVAVDAELREAQVAPAGLARAEQLPLAAQLEVDLGELEAVGRVDERLQTRLARRRSAPRAWPRDEQAVALLRPTPDPAAQLVELGEAEAVGLLHDHDRRVRDVDADLDHGRRDEHVELALLELRASPRAARRASAARAAARRGSPSARRAAAARPRPRPRARAASPTARSAGRRRTPAGPRRDARADARTPRSTARHRPTP